MNRSRKRRREFERKMRKRRVILLLSIATIIGITTIGAFVGFRKDNTKDALASEGGHTTSETQDKVDKNEFTEEEKVPIEEFVGVSEAGKPYKYDANIIGEKLKNYDYSNNGEKIVFLTFDDGTSTTNTPKVLDILKQNDVKATFFLSGTNIEKGGEKAKELVKREFDEGHAIGNHSYTHNYATLYPGRTLNLDNFISDFKKSAKLFKEIIGENFSTRVIRCPGGHMSWKGMDKLDSFLGENNMVSIDWNALNKDSEGKKKNSSELVQEAIKSSEGKEIVVLLMHDTYGKEETVKALPGIIKYFKDNGYAFKTLT